MQARYWNFTPANGGKYKLLIMATKVLYPENTPIVLRYDYTLGQFPPRQGDKFVHIYISDESIDPSFTGLNLANPDKDEIRFTQYAPPVAANPTSINPSVSFVAPWTFPAGITQGLFFLFLDAGRKTLHPDYAGILVTGSSLLVNVPTSGIYAEYALISLKDGKPVSLLGNSKVVSVESAPDKAAALGMLSLVFDEEPDYVASPHTPGFVGTNTKNQAGLLSDSVDQAVSVPGGGGGGYWRQDLTSFDFHNATAFPDGTALHLWLVYDLAANTNTQRLAALSSTAGNATFQFAASDTAAVNQSRIMIRNNSNGTFINELITGYRDLNSHEIFVKLKKVGANFEMKFFARDVGGAAAQIGATVTVTQSGNNMTFNVLSFMAWVRSTVTNNANGKFQYGGFKAGAEITDVNILDLMNTGNLS
jgi:hypothetical protein